MMHLYKLLGDFDRHYKHLVLWDRENLVIAGAYRLGKGKGKKS